MIYVVIYLDGFSFQADRGFALQCLRENKSVACVEAREGSEVVERITR